MSALGQDKALIFRITHIDNMPWVLDHGVHCRNSPTFDPNYRNIGNPELIERRHHRTVPIPPGGVLSDYIPFYFTPSSIMLFNIKTGWGGMQQVPQREIVILVSSLRTLAARNIPFVFTDRHAYLEAAQGRFSSSLDDLDRIDWKIISTRDFKTDLNDPGKKERYQAEALVHRQVPLDALAGLACHGEEQAAILRAELARRELTLKVVVKPDWYFR